MYGVSILLANLLSAVLSAVETPAQTRRLQGRRFPEQGDYNVRRKRAVASESIMAANTSRKARSPAMAVSGVFFKSRLLKASTA